MQSLFKGHKNIRLDILTVHRRFLKVVARESPTTSTPRPKELLEEIAESRAAEMKFDTTLPKTPWKSLVRAATARRRLKSTLLPVGAISVILFPLFRIAQDFIGLIDFLKFLLRRLLVLRRIRMVLARKFPEGALDFFLGGSF